MTDTLPAATPKETGELRDLQEQIARARCVLANLKSQIAAARKQAAFEDSGYLVQVNEQLIVSALQNLTEAEEATQALGALSKSYGLDLLTQLPSRVLLQDRFSHAIANADRHRTRMAILFADIDGFKRINDTFGHAVGDEILKHAADCVVNSVRDVDFVCRYGGDEFVVLVTEVSQASDAALVAEKIASAVAATITVENQTISISLSIGVSIYPEDGIDPATLIQRADAAMYEAKRWKVARLGPVQP